LHRKEKDPDLVRVSTRSPGIDGMPAKIPASEAGAAAGGGFFKVFFFKLI
jgi:hypothetical protein